MRPQFNFGPEGERTLAAGEYLLGLLELALVVGALWLAARLVRALALPGWRGAPAWLAESVLVLAALVLVSEALGTFGAFGEVELIVASLGLAGVTLAVSARLASRPRAGAELPAPGASATAKAIAVVATAAVLAGWAVPTLGSVAGGMDRADTLWYHMPLAAKFVQTGSLGEIFFFDPIFFASFYPSNYEIFQAVPILAFGRDILSPVLNLGFLGIGLLASWCIGRPFGAAPQALVGGAIALGAQMLVEFQAGEALNDIAGVAFVLAAAALLVNGYAASSRRARAEIPAPRVTGRRIGTGALAVAGLAAGLAAGTKLSFLAPVAALTVGVVVIAPRGVRRAAALAWTLPMLAAGAYWYLRNAIATGNPIPYVHSIGPIELPAPERSFELRPGFPVAHYWNDPVVWWDWFIPGLAESFGMLWPLTLAAMVGGSAYAVWRGGEPVLRLLGAMALFTAFAYLFTPLTAAGEEGEPIAFVWNVRYIAPAVAVALALLPCLPALRASASRRNATTVALALLLAATVASLVQWKQGHAKGAIAAAALAIAAAAGLAWLRSRNLVGPAARRRSVVAVGLATLLVGIFAGWFGQRHYLERRYENTSPKLELASMLRWARDLRDARIAVAGVRGVFNQYPLYGIDLSNHVQWLGTEGDHKAWLRIQKCERWRREINAGDYTHVVTTYDPYHSGRLTDTKEALWTRDDPAAEQILRQGPVNIFAIEGKMDPAGCLGLPDLNEAELNGDSVNAEPLANQPPGTGELARRLERALQGS